MKELAIVICNFNKQEYVLKCIDSVLQSTYKNEDIYVVDNASSDASVELIKKEFNDKVILIVNEENKGGSGGFNTGIREALKKDYKYVMLLDNDVILERNAIGACFNYLENNKDAAVAGSKIYSMDNPKQIQEMGASIDFENYSITPFYKGFVDDGNIPEIVNCDYVPACSMMIRTSAIKEVGLMPEENFIYWDDIDWGYRFKLNGYKVVALSKSIVWHKMGVAQKKNTFGTYYFWRNRVKFFMTYCDLEQRKKFAEILFKELFQGIYMCNYIGKYSSAVTILSAVLDSINGVVGRGDNNKILDLEKVESSENKLKRILRNKNNIAIIKRTDINHIRNIVNIVMKVKPNISITIFMNENDIKKQFINENIYIDNNLKESLNKDLIIETCTHISNIKNQLFNYDNRIYIDNYFNIIENSIDVEYIKNYDKEEKFFRNTLYPLILRGILNNNIKRDEHV